jgi:predicted RNA-binding Zn-ribbon protein involved in translation (DUF1610 family)
MSIAAHTEFTCPSCGAVSKVQTRGPVNAQTDPSAKTAILKGTYFNYRCAACGNEIRLLYNCLYIDPDLRQAICLITDGSNDAEHVPLLKNGGYILRIVRSVNDLREKLLIFDAALDDRIVEIAKGTALSQLPTDSFVSEIHFEVIGGLRVLVLIHRDERNENDGEDEINYVTDFPRLYDELARKYASSLPPLRGDTFQCVDVEYAAEFLRNLPVEENR